MSTWTMTQQSVTMKLQKFKLSIAETSKLAKILEEKTVNLKFTLILFTLPAEGNGDAAITVTNFKNVFYISFCYYAATRE